MTEWTRPALNNPGRAARTPDSLASLSQLERTMAATPRPFVLITERELSVLRRGLTKDGWKRSLYLQPSPSLHGIQVGAGMLSVANRWLESEIQIPPKAGWIHDFFCDCGDRLAAPQGLHLADEYSCPTCEKTYSGPVYDGAVYNLQHDELAGAARSLGIVYGIEKDREYAEKAAEILLRYADAYPGPHTDIRNGGMYLQSLGESVWIIALAQAYDLIYYSRCLGDDDRERIERDLFRAVAEGLAKMPMEGNWGSWHLSALGVIGLAIKDPSMVRQALDAFGSQMAEQLGDDGLWPESVHTHFYALTAFVYLAEACQRAGIDIYNWEPKPGKSLKTMFNAPLDYAYPSFRLPAIHDGQCETVLPLDLYEIAYRRWGDPSFAWVLKRGYKFGDQPVASFQVENRDKYRRTSFFAFLFGRDLPGRTGEALLTGHNFNNIGICTLRGADDLMVTLDHGRFLDHGHLDKLGFTLFANGVTAMPEYGSPGFGSELVRWSKSTAGHNTVVVDGVDQQQSEKMGLVLHHAGGYIQCAEAVADDCHPGVTHMRKVVVVGSTCIVADRLISADEHDYDWLVRCEGDPHLDGDYVATDIDTQAYELVKQDRAFSVAECCKLRWECENGATAFWMWPQTQAGVVLGTCPTSTQASSASFFMCRQHAADATFIAAIAATRPDSDVDVTKDGCVLRIQTADVVDEVFVRGWGEESDTGTLETDGELAAVRSIGDAAVAVALVKGSWVRWNGALLLECPCQVDCVEFLGEEPGPSIRYSCDTAGIVKIQTNARAMKVNGFRASATRSDGSALVRITPQMLAGDMRVSNN